MVESLPSTYEVLGLIPSTMKDESNNLMRKIRFSVEKDG